ncbi:hypothetical protein [Microbacterium sp. cx-59]|uniref:hypothetical protein n=1 Tax=Microbacterium sp. cx-59 TaxID=2891207 RepID=UPI001E48CEDD|nr:hypothetical protein [Microbacterium sp. cx-59]MCC4908103.1 hypothetical protein [Microbacterium sp. cx-59]
MRKARLRRIELAQDRSTTNQDGIDFGPSWNDIVVDGISGSTVDDGFSIFAQTTAGFCHSYYKQAGVATETKNILIRNVSLNVGMNVVRLQAGDGLKLSGVKMRSIENLNDDTSTNNYAVLMFGESGYVTTQPTKADLSNIDLRGYHGRGDVVIGASSHFSSVTADDVTLTMPWKAIVGIAQVSPNFATNSEDVTIRNLVSLDGSTDSVGSAINLPGPALLAGLVMMNWVIKRCQNIFNNNGQATRITATNIAVETIVGQIARSATAGSGTIDLVTVGGGGGTTRWAGVPTNLRLGPNMPTITSVDTTPSSAVKGSVIRCDHTKEPAGGAGTTGGEYVATGTAWTKRVDLGAAF